MNLKSTTLEQQRQTGSVTVAAMGVLLAVSVVGAYIAFSTGGIAAAASSVLAIGLGIVLPASLPHRPR